MCILILSTFAGAEMGQIISILICRSSTFHHAIASGRISKVSVWAKLKTSVVGDIDIIIERTRCGTFVG